MRFIRLFVDTRNVKRGFLIFIHETSKSGWMTRIWCRTTQHLSYDTTFVVRRKNLSNGKNWSSSFFVVRHKSRVSCKHPNNAITLCSSVMPLGHSLRISIFPEPSKTPSAILMPFPRISNGALKGRHENECSEDLTVLNNHKNSRKTMVRGVQKNVPLLWWLLAIL
jgi:hypothetical protein